MHLSVDQCLLPTQDMDLNLDVKAGFRHMVAAPNSGEGRL